MCGDERAGGQASCGQRTACIKSEPAYPQQAGPNEAENDAVRRHRLFRVPDPLAQVDGANQS